MVKKMKVMALAAFFALSTQSVYPMDTFQKAIAPARDVLKFLVELALMNAFVEEAVDIKTSPAKGEAIADYAVALGNKISTSGVALEKLAPVFAKLAPIINPLASLGLIAASEGSKVTKMTESMKKLAQSEMNAGIVLSDIAQLIVANKDVRTEIPSLADQIAQAKFDNAYADWVLNGKKGNEPKRDAYKAISYYSVSDLATPEFPKEEVPAVRAYKKTEKKPKETKPTTPSMSTITQTQNMPKPVTIEAMPEGKRVWDFEKKAWWYQDKNGWYDAATKKWEYKPAVTTPTAPSAPALTRTKPAVLSAPAEWDDQYNMWWEPKYNAYYDETRNDPWGYDDDWHVKPPSTSHATPSPAIPSAPSVPVTQPTTPAKPTGERSALLGQIQSGVQLRPAGNRPSTTTTSTPRAPSMGGYLQQGIQGRRSSIEPGDEPEDETGF